MSNNVDLLPANLQGTLHQAIERANISGGGIMAVLLSTAEGVPLGRVYADLATPLSEEVLSSIESTWAPASKQFPLLGLGKEARIVTAIFDHGTIFHVYQAPVVVTILVSSQSNLGSVRATAIPSLKEVLEPLCTTLLDSLAPARDDWQETETGYQQQGYYQ